ncbi:ChbG/HpnK family deacetylase [Promicromonospora sp. Populi]|uniref:ChbG/HpnK family deacetylase n=1 Tax=Promicromonospora sp. Populi TaxID=3239420 RepID=UPI0034E2C652
MTRSLVLTADDAGLDPDADREIAALLAGSPLTAVGVITAADPADQAGRGHHGRRVDDVGPSPGEPGAPAAGGAARAVELIAKAAPDVAPGVHVVLPVPEPDGGFDDVVDRIIAQVTALSQATAAVGLPAPDRLDSHQGTLYGLRGRSYLGEAIGLCARLGLALRLPRGLELYGDDDPVLTEPGVRARHAMAVAAADAAGVPLPRVIGTHRGGDLEARDYPTLRDHYLRLLERLPEGTSEIFLHPSPDTARLRATSAGWWQKRTWELRLLGDPDFIREIERQGIDLVGRW